MVDLMASAPDGLFNVIYSLYKTNIMMTYSKGGHRTNYNWVKM